jgi:hypothetical protein
MVLTKEIVDALAPEHGRTSCDDGNLANSHGGWNGKYDENTGRKVINYPRCNRCYLLDHLGEDLDKLSFRVNVCLEWREG